jgi:fructose-1,6-bisphosphatase/sedoheptulose 1,7-bisphosphatase-like protein
MINDILISALKNSAISSLSSIGSNDKNLCDELCTEALRLSLISSNINATVVIGEGEIDEAPMLYKNEMFGNGNDYDIAVDPLDGTNLAAKNLPNAVSAIMFTKRHSILEMPEVYVEKIASVKVKHNNVISIKNSLEENLINLAKYLNKNLENLSIAILDRERHKNEINILKKLGTKIYLIQDGDIVPIIQTKFDIDLYIGIGGSPEAVLAMGAMKCLNGFMEIKFIFFNEEEKNKILNYNLELEKIYTIDDVIKGEVFFGMSGITSGFLNGIIDLNEEYKVNILLLNSFDKIYQNITQYVPKN